MQHWAAGQGTLPFLLSFLPGSLQQVVQNSVSQPPLFYKERMKGQYKKNSFNAWLLTVKRNAKLKSESIISSCKHVEDFKTSYWSSLTLYWLCVSSFTAETMALVLSLHLGSCSETLKHLNLHKA